jgi:hypothetical protein
MVRLAEARNETVLDRDADVLSRAVSRLSDLWKLTNAQVGKVIGVSPPTVSRLRSGSFYLERGTKPFELAQYLVRLFRSLDSLTGSDDEAAISWLNTENQDLNGRPIDLIRSVKGLSEVTNYVDDFRARI